MNVTFEGIELDFDDSLVDASPAEIRRQIAEFESGDRRQFDLDVSIPDSFTGDVMAAMTDVPYGQTRTYGSIATALGTSPVAVGQACGRNPTPIVVPCHRVVGTRSLGGFSAGGDRNLELKRRLLARERVEGVQTTLDAHF